MSERLKDDLSPLFYEYVQVEGYEWPTSIVHIVKDRIWVEWSYHDDYPQGTVQVGDGLTNGHNPVTGNQIISVPIDKVVRFLSEEEAMQICACIEADKQLMQYAHG